MTIDCIRNEGYVSCKSSFYSALDSLSHSLCFSFSPGINKLVGEIDSGNWAVSYLLSMYRHRPEDFVLFDPPKVVVNKKELSLNSFSRFSCYMDLSDPLFSFDGSLEGMIQKGLEENGLNYSPDDVRALFQIDADRFNRPLTAVGNEIFKAMAAIGYSYKKEFFCFPWLSNKRLKSYHENLTFALRMLENLGKTVILPVGAETPHI